MFQAVKSYSNSSSIYRLLTYF